MLVDDLFIEGVNVEGWWMAIDRGSRVKRIVFTRRSIDGWRFPADMLSVDNGA